MSLDIRAPEPVPANFSSPKTLHALVECTKVREQLYGYLGQSFRARNGAKAGTSPPGLTRTRTQPRSVTICGGR